MTKPLALSYGMGVDSAAVLVGWWSEKHGDAPEVLP